MFHPSHSAETEIVHRCQIWGLQGGPRLPPRLSIRLGRRRWAPPPPRSLATRIILVEVLPLRTGHRRCARLAPAPINIHSRGRHDLALCMESKPIPLQTLGDIRTGLVMQSSLATTRPISCFPAKGLSDQVPIPDYILLTLRRRYRIGICMGPRAAKRVPLSRASLST